MTVFTRVYGHLNVKLKKDDNEIIKPGNLSLKLIRYVVIARELWSVEQILSLSLSFELLLNRHNLVKALKIFQNTPFL